MDRFSVGDQVVIRYGTQQRQKGTIVKHQMADVYRVKLEDGAVLFFSGKGLEMKQTTNPPFCLSRANAIVSDLS